MRSLLIVILLITVIIVIYLLHPVTPIITTKPIDKGYFDDSLSKSFRDEITLWTDKANSNTNILKSSIYRSYAMSNLYFLKPYISLSEYSSLETKIGERLDPRVPRYINPDIVLSIVRR